MPDLHRCGRRVYRRSPDGVHRPQAGRDHLRRNAGAGHPGGPGAPQPLGGDGKAVQREPGGALQLFRQARYKSEGGRQDHGKIPHQRRRQG